MTHIAEIVPDLPLEVAQVYEGYPAEYRGRLQELRSTLFTTCQKLYGTGQLQESLKWGEPAYRPLPPHGGTTVRLHWKPKYGAQVGVFVPCQTTLVADMRALYGDLLSFEGNRCLWLPGTGPYPEEAVAHFFAEAFRYGRKRTV